MSCPQPADLCSPFMGTLREGIHAGTTIRYQRQYGPLSEFSRLPPFRRCLVTEAPSADCDDIMIYAKQNTGRVDGGPRGD